MSCNCVTEANKAYTESVDLKRFPDGVATVVTGFSFSTKHCYSAPIIQVNLEYTNKNGNKSNKKFDHLAKYCPFCGVKYVEDKEIQ